MKLNQKKSAPLLRVMYLLAVALIPVMLGISGVTYAKSYGLIKIKSTELSAQDTISKQKTSTATIKNKPTTSKPARAATAQTNKPKVDQVKYPPPVVRVAKSKGSAAPAPKPKISQVHFPPPVVKPVNSNTKTPPRPRIDPLSSNGSVKRTEEAPPPPPQLPKASEMPGKAPPQAP